MGEVVDANRMATTPYDLSFRVDRKDDIVCEKTLSQDDIVNFRKVGPLPSSLAGHSRLLVDQAAHDAGLCAAGCQGRLVLPDVL